MSLISDSIHIHFILLSSMGVTDPDDFLNSIGKDKDGNGHGDLLIWKRKAEEYLIKVSSVLVDPVLLLLLFFLGEIIVH